MSKIFLIKVTAKLETADHMKAVDVARQFRLDPDPYTGMSPEIMSLKIEEVAR